MSNIGTSLKRRKSDSEDSVQEVAAENTSKRQKQENRDTSTTENPADNENSQETGNGRETRIVAMEDGSESTNTAEFGKSMRDNYFLAATEITAKYIAEHENSEEIENATDTENTAENKNTEEAETGTEVKNIAEKENTEEVKYGTETENIAEKENTEEVKYDTQTKNISENENAEEAENGTQTKHIAEHENAEEAENGTHTKNIADSENAEEAENGTQTKNIAENENAEEAENGTQTKNTAENENAEEAGNGTQTKNIAENENAEEAENGTQTKNISVIENAEEVENVAEIDNCARKEGSEIANSTEETTTENPADNENSQETENGRETRIVAMEDGPESTNTAEFVQVPQGIDKDTSVKEEDLIQREEEPVDNVPSRSWTSHEYHHQTSDTWHSVRIQRLSGAEPDGSSSEGTIDVYNTDGYVSEHVITNKFRNSLRCKDLFYHGTTREFAISIIEQGINLKKTHRVLDFSQGKGFYLTDNYDKAFYWSKRKGKRNCSKGAVIAFAVDADIRRERHLSLKVDSDTNRKFWECIVGHFRRGQTSPDVKRVLRDVKYIEGPVAMIRKRGLTSSEILPPHDRGQFRQLCICDQGYAKRFGSLTNILCVVFLKD